MYVLFTRTYGRYRYVYILCFCSRSVILFTRIRLYLLVAAMNSTLYNIHITQTIRQKRKQAFVLPFFILLPPIVLHSWLFRYQQPRKRKIERRKKRKINMNRKYKNVMIQNTCMQFTYTIHTYKSIESIKFHSLSTIVYPLFVFYATTLVTTGDCRTIKSDQKYICK